MAQQATVAPTIFASSTNSAEAISKQELKAHLGELQAPPDMETLEAALSLHVKEDLGNALLVYFIYLSALTDSPMTGILIGETSTGKTWIQVSVAWLYPAESDLAQRDRYIMVKGFSSPTSFYHERGEYDRLTRESTIACFPKVYSFLDMPNKQLLDKMKTLLSHDQHEISFTYTDPNGRSRTVKMVGWPAVIYSTTDLKMTGELSNRGWLITPKRCPEKWEQACQLVAARERDTVEFDKTLEDDPAVKKLRDWHDIIIRKARLQGPFRIQIHDQQQVLNRFKEIAGKLQARSARDLSRIFSLIKSIALFHGRTETTDADVDRAFQIVDPIIGCNIRGISPTVMSFYEDIIKPLQAEKGPAQDLERAEIRAKYREIYAETLDKHRYDHYVEALNHHGLIELVPHPTHRGWNLVRPILEESSTPKGVITLETNKYAQTPLGGLQSPILGIRSSPPQSD